MKDKKTAKGFYVEEQNVPKTKKRFTREKSPMGTAFDGSMTLSAAPTQKKRSSKKNTSVKETEKKRTNRKTDKLLDKRDATQEKSVATSRKKRIAPPRESNAEFIPFETVVPTKKTRKKQATPQTETLEITKPTQSKRKKALKIIFLGGVGEVGKNITAIEYGNDIIVIDAGMTFPNGEDMPGIDAVVPDTTYLAQNKDKIKGIFLTHGHEDHIGGLPYLMKELNPDTPIYGTKLTLMLVDNKLQEHRIQTLSQKVVSAGGTVKAGVFEIEFINVNHSICGACALAIRTPEGLIYHSGDFKIDLTPVAGEPIDLKRIAQLGSEGVLLYMSESTNIERPGYTMGEAVVATTLDHLFSGNMTRRLIIATFASNIHRLQQIIDLAVKYNRKVALSGRSMLKIVDAAVKIGELKIPDNVLVDIEKAKNFQDKELLIVSTGSQGEPMSA